MFKIIFVDNHLLAVDKPAGLLTQPDSSGRKSLESVYKRWVKNEYQKPGNVYLEAAHRIDKPASGVVLFARTSKSVSRLKESVRNRDSIKIYQALVEGDLPDEGELENFLVHDDFRARVVPNKTKRSKLAKLKYRVLERYSDYSLVEVNLETGRYHQIRIQFAEIGCPIIGDSKYGSQFEHSMEGIALHHHRLVIPHPTKPELMKFESVPPWI